MTSSTSSIRTRWAAIGAAVAVSLGAGGGFGFANAVQDSGERATFTAISPCRLTDTRSTNQIGPRGTKLGADETVTVVARGAQGKCAAEQLPADATALVLNVTALGASELSFFTFWPNGARPEAASLNPSPGAPPVPNAVTVQLSDTGSFNLYNERGTVNVVIDVAGYYTDHNHDDRYYTKAETDAAIATGGSGGDVYTTAETDLAIQTANDEFLELLVGPNGPVKINTKAAQANTNHIERKQTIAVNRHAFMPQDLEDGRAIDNTSGGVYIPAGSSGNELWAPVEIPDGAVVTGVRARLIDNINGSSLAAQLFQVSPTGGRGVIGQKLTTAPESPSPIAREYTGSAADRNDDDGVTYEIRVTIDQGVSWPTVSDDLQLVAFFVDYEMEVEPVL